MTAINNDNEKGKVCTHVARLMESGLKAKAWTEPAWPLRTCFFSA